jgi:preprotein translocase subunit SecG
MTEFWFNFLYTTLLVILVLVCAFMILLVLMQRSKQEGIGAAFGSETTQSVFGAQTSDVLSKLTVYCAVIFFALTLTLSTMTSLQARSSSADRLAEKPIIPTADAPFNKDNFDQALEQFLISTGVKPPQQENPQTDFPSDANWQDITLPAPAQNP